MLEQPETRVTSWPVRAAFLWVAAIGSGATAWLILTGHPQLGGVPAALAAIGVVGRVAPHVPETPRARFADMMVERAFEGCLLIPLAWANRGASPRMTALALIGLGASYLASYEQVKARSLGYRGEESRAYRGTRAAILVLGLLSTFVEVALWGFAALAAAAAAVRATDVAEQERAARRAGPPDRSGPAGPVGGAT
jgi:hypothetical protein